MICINGKGWQSTQIERTLEDGPHYSETFQLDGGVALLSRGESFGATLDNFENLLARGIQLDVSQRVTQAKEAGCVGKKVHRLQFVEVPNHQIA